jgi:hypothetical protein
MYLCARYTEYALHFDLMGDSLLTIPMDALKIN